MNYENLEQELLKFLQQNLKKTGAENFVIGISGGLDSAVVSALCAKIKPQNTLGLILPSKNSNERNLNDAIKHCENFKIKYEILNIQPFLDEFLKAEPNANRLRIGNFTARIRMNLLYDYSAKNRGVVVGTSNLSERMLGYGTIFGDLACAFNPIGEIFKSDLFEFAKFLKIDKNIINKAPSADLWQGQSDEKELGYSYEKLDKILKILRENGDLQNAEPEILNFIKNRIKQNKFKLKMPQIAKVKG